MASVSSSPSASRLATSPASRLVTADPEGFNATLTRMAALIARPAVEFSMLMADPVYWGWGVPRGDGHSVLAMPGLGGGDVYLRPLRGWLRRIGYRTVDSGIDVNVGWSDEVFDALSALVEQECRRSGTKLTIIGHSLGGVYGYAIGARQPQTVRHVIALGSPLRFVRRSLPSSVAITAFYSRRDSIVSPEAAIARDQHARNVEVESSHMGMASHPDVYRRLGPVLRQ